MKSSFDILPLIMFTIPFDVNRHLAPQGRFPSNFDKEHVPEALYVSMINEYHEKNDHVMFSNVEFQYESCDCEYPCSHRPWISGFNLRNIKDINFYFEDDENLVVEKQGNYQTIFILNLKNSKLTVGDFHRMFKIHGIELKLSHYAMTLISTEKISHHHWLKFQKLKINIPQSTTLNKSLEIIKEKYNISLMIYNRYLTETEIGYSIGVQLPQFDIISDLSNGADNKNDGVVSVDFDVTRKRGLTYILKYLLSDLYEYHSGSMEHSFQEWKTYKKRGNFF